MDRKNFCRTTCGLGIGSCFGFGLFVNDNSPVSEKLLQETPKGTPLVPFDQRQIKNVLCFVDSSMDEAAKKQVFERLGYEHLTNEAYKNRIIGFRKDLKGFFNRVNTNQDTYWERLAYDPVSSEIKLTGKVVDKCACPYAQCEKPPKSLCNYCCRNFQKQFFETLLERPVDVRIDDAFLLGGKRCSTTIFVRGKLALEKIS
jgi:hypothetical protein